MLSKDCKVTCFIETVLQLLSPFYIEGEEIERRIWSHFEAYVPMYVFLKYRAYVKPLVAQQGLQSYLFHRDRSSTSDADLKRMRGDRKMYMVSF